MLDIVKVKNVGDKPVTLRHDRYGDMTLDPGKSRIIPLAIALVNFGNPGAIDIDAKNKLREAERRHVWGWWGYFPGLMTPAEWEALRPTIEVYDVEDNRVYMVHDDPYGEHASSEIQGAVIAATDPDALYQAGLAMQQKRLAEAEDSDDEHPLIPGDETGITQAQRNALRDEIPTPAHDEPAPKRDAPRAPRSGPRRHG